MRVSLLKHSTWRSPQVLVIVSFTIVTGIVVVSRLMAATTVTGFPTSRSAQTWPFSRYSIWNMPIGQNAVYKPSGLKVPAHYNPEENLVVMSPSSPGRNVMTSKSSGWDGTNRCLSTGAVFIAGLPVPTSYLTYGPTGMADQGGLANAAAAILKSDGRTIVQTQPFTTCPDGSLTSRYYKDGDRNDDIIDGQGIVGAQGGSGMSSLGGTLRYGELTPASGHVYHALKITVYALANLYYDTTGYRWPAINNDGYANKSTYAGTNPDLKMGALLAIPASTDLTTMGLTTGPAKELAWTLQHYGAYIVDDSAWDDLNIAVEHGTNGRFLAQFKANWGFDFAATPGTSWQTDLNKLFGSLSVITNNGPTNIGGGGNPLWCYAPKLAGETRSNPNGATTEPAGCPSNPVTATPMPATPTPPPVTPTPAPGTLPGTSANRVFEMENSKVTLPARVLQSPGASGGALLQFGP